ncbi:HAD domain-containing protein [Ramlibacter sp. AN1133]|uniref:HAD domain-containing protein n=1 Tax=Ramlibacter sp. AN1133 TaxID=3133429 RepID=UPI0030BB35B5
MRFKAVFADIDGVMHRPPNSRGPDSVAAIALASGTQLREQGLFCWTEHLEQALAEADEATGDAIVLVIHSSWRKQPWVSMQMLREALGPLGHRLMAITSPDLEREASIVDLAERAGIDDFIVIDDASAEFSPRIKNLVVTNPLRGVSDPGVLAAVRDWAGAGRARVERALKVPVA